jgi:uncharacterized membrane protein YeaQ/YmgE (transglycosylase-associated protein family)
MAMFEDVFIMFIAIVPYAALGSGVRVVWGIYKAYDKFLAVHIKRARVVVEFLAGIVFGVFGGVLLSTVGVFTIGMSLGTLVSSMLGANVIELIAKKFGWSKKMDVVVSDQQLEFPELTERQINALQYVQKQGRITNREYQSINRTTRDVAKYELASLVELGKLKRIGKTKDIVYVTAGKSNQNNRVKIG